MSPRGPLAGKRAFFFDGDGTLYLDGAALPGAAATLRKLRDQGHEVFFLTNNSSKSKRDYLPRLVDMGFPFTEDRLLTSTDHTVARLREEKLRSLHLLGTPSLEAEFRSLGFDLDAPHPDAVVLGYDTSLTYEKLARAAVHLGRGIPWYATHGDLVCPSRDGPMPDAGAMIALLRAATGREPHVLGKPDPAMILPTLARLGLSASDAVIVGDRLYTDILLGNRAGATSVCVLTGEARREDLARPTLSGRPDHVIPSVADLPSLL